MLGVHDIYGGQIAEWRKQGETLQMIGDKTGVCRERIRQILNQHYHGTVSNYFKECEVAKILEISVARVANLRLKGLVHPLRIGLFWLYDIAQIKKLIILITHYCKNCGVQLSGQRRIWCEKCYAEFYRNQYKFMTPERKKVHIQRVTTWISEHPEQFRPILSRANKKWQKNHPEKMKLYAQRRKDKFWSSSPQYVIVRGKRTGETVTGIGYEKGCIKLLDGTKIPNNYVHKGGRNE